MAGNGRDYVRTLHTSDSINWMCHVSPSWTSFREEGIECSLNTSVSASTIQGSARGSASGPAADDERPVKSLLWYESLIKLNNSVYNILHIVIEIEIMK